MHALNLISFAMSFSTFMLPPTVRGVPFPLSSHGFHRKSLIPIVSKPPALMDSQAVRSDVESATSSTSSSSRKRPHELASSSGDHGPQTEGAPRARQRTSSTTSVETIRVKTKKTTITPPREKSPARSSKCSTAGSAATARAKAPLRKLKEKLKSIQNRAPPELDLEHGSPGVLATEQSAQSESEPLYFTKKSGFDLLVAAIAHTQASDATIRARNVPEPRSSAPSTGEMVKDAVLKPTRGPHPPRARLELKTVALQALCGNTAYSQTPTIPLSESLDTIAPTVSAPKKDQWGCVHLDAGDLDLSITFFKTPHFVLWDVQDDIHVAWPAQLSLTIKHAHLWENSALAVPNINLLDIRCSAQSAYSRYSRSLSEAFMIKFIGAKTEVENGVPTQITHEDGIHSELDWIRTYAKTGRAGDQGDELGPEPSKRGWCLKIWIPLPTRLFVKRETRMFQLEANVWIGEEDTDVVTGRAEMSISHLRKDREMVV